MGALFPPPPAPMRSNIFQLLYNTYLHNAEAIGYFGMAAVVFLLLLWKPKRWLALWLLGFVLLLVRFQYLKHIVGPLYDQTAGVLFEGVAVSGSQRRTYFIFNVLAPFGMYAIGWGSIIVGALDRSVILHLRKKTGRSSSAE
jgi:hypothetical protein